MNEIKFNMCVISHCVAKYQAQMTANQRGQYFTSIIGNSHRQSLFSAAQSASPSGTGADNQMQKLSQVPEDRRMRSFIEN